MRTQSLITLQRDRSVEVHPPANRMRGGQQLIWGQFDDAGHGFIVPANPGLTADPPPDSTLRDATAQPKSHCSPRREADQDLTLNLIGGLEKRDSLEAAGPSHRHRPPRPPRIARDNPHYHRTQGRPHGVLSCGWIGTTTTSDSLPTPIHFLARHQLQDKPFRPNLSAFRPGRASPVPAASI